MADRNNQKVKRYSSQYENLLDSGIKITGKIKSEDALRESEELHRITLGSISDAVFITDHEGAFIYICPNVSVIFGYSFQEVARMGNISFLLGDGLFDAEKIDTADEIPNIERNIRDKNDRQHDLLVTVKRVDIRGGTILYTCRDITERKQAEEAVRESEERYRAFFENSIDAAMITSPDGSIQFVNSEACRLFGMTKQELLAVRRESLIDESDPRLVPSLEDLARTGKFRGEIRLRRKDGTLFLGEISTSVFTDRNGHPRTAGIFRDITERKKLEEKNVFLSAIVESSQDAIIGKTLEGTITSWNKGAEKVYGYTEAEVIGKSIFILVPPNRVGEARHFFEQVKQGAYIHNYETNRVKKDGTELSVSLNISPINNSEGQIIGASTIAQDITKCKKAEEALAKLNDELEIKVRERTAQLAESEEKYRLVVENAAEAIAITQDRMPKYFNPRLVEITGYSAEDIKSKHFIDFIHPEDRNRVEEIYRKRISGEEAPKIYEFKLITNDGSTCWMRMNANLVTWEGRPATLNIFSDITEEKNLREQLTEYAHRITMVQEEERKRIAYELHDDTAQYLSILKMQLGALIRSNEIQSPNIKEKLKFLEKDADRAFNDVRRYSHELRPVVLEHMGLLASLDQIADDYNKLGEVSIEVNVVGIEPELSEDAKLGFFRIAQEALNNIRKHAKASNATITVSFQENRVDMVVSDNGIGFNVQEATSQIEKKGSLGLMSMRERADLIGADLKIESKPGQGTTIRAVIPL